MPRVVVLPHPFGPTRLATIPGSTVRESSLTTVLSPYRFVTPLIRSPLKGGSPFRSRLWSARCRTNQRRRFPLLLVALDYEDFDEPRGESTAYTPKLVEEEIGVLRTSRRSCSRNFARAAFSEVQPSRYW